MAIYFQNHYFSYKLKESSLGLHKLNTFRDFLHYHFPTYQKLESSVKQYG